MHSLFSVFDPLAMWGMPLNWLSLMVSVIMIPSFYWVMSSQISFFGLNLMNTLKTELSSVSGKFNFPGFINISLVLFLMIMLNNLLGLFPYVFTATSHLSITLAWGLPVWSGYYIMAWVKSTKTMLSHLVPSGSPLVLSPFMVMIEMISSLMRPMTLSIRLAANMTAGHLLLVLLSSPSFSVSSPVLMLVMCSLVLLLILELGVALIQAYVFSALSLLYMNEVNPSLSN